MLQRQKGLCLSIILILVCGFALVGCLETVEKGNGEMRDNDLEFAVPSSINLLSVQELQSLNKFFDKIKEFAGVQRESNPIVLTSEEFNRIPKTKLNLEIPQSVQFFISGFYNSAGHTLESQSGVFASQAILYGNEADADLAEKNLMKMKRKYYSVVYRKGNVAGSTNMYRPRETTKEFWELVDFIEKNGFKITKVPPKPKTE